MAADTLLINDLVNALIIDIEDRLDELAEQKLRIPMFVATGSNIFSGWGPDIPIRIMGIATPEIKLRGVEVSSNGPRGP